MSALLGFLGAVLGAAIGAYFTWLSAQRHAQDQFRLAALEKRLEVHQKAFTLWNELFTHLHATDISDIVPKCEKWWISHRINSGPESSEVFYRAYILAHGFHAIPPDDDMQTEHFEIIKDAGRIIVEAVSLPAMQNGEDRRIEPNKALLDIVAHRPKL